MLRNTPALTNQFLIKQLPGAIVFVDLDFNIAAASDSWADTLDLGIRDVTHKNIHKLLPWASQAWKDTVMACFHGNFPEPLVESHIDTDKKRKWFEWTNIPWYNENENIIGAIIQAKDITQGMNEDQKIAKLELFLNETQEIGKIGNLEYNQLQDHLDCCPMVRNILEVDSQFEFSLDNFLAFFQVGYDRNTISMALYNAMENQRSWSEKLRIVTAKGQEKWIIVSGRAIYTQGIYTGLIGIVQDITEHVLTEQKTRDNEHLLRTLINNLPMQIYIKDRESKRLLANRPELEYCGVQHESDLIGKDDFDIYDAATAQKYREEDVEVMISQNAMLNKELFINRPDGTTATYLSSKIPLKGNNGETNGLVGITIDISDLKQKEKELKKLIHVTSQQNKKLVNFAHIVSHHLRSHSANFSMLLDFLNTEEDEQERKNIVGMLTGASNKLMETLHNLNEIVAINTEATVIKKNVDLEAELDQVLAGLSDLLEKSRTSIITEIPKNTMIQVAPTYLESIIQHLVENAIKYKKPDVDPIIKFSVTYVQHYTILSIEDNGMGIDMKKYGNKIFGMYKTFHGNQDAKGLGLFIVKNKVEAMDGKINAKSKVGVGTTINLYFNEEN